ncbi:MAG: hypothetical protein V3U35_04290, partial [Candidatus Neomarinimicrobiota bacterium]
AFQPREFISSYDWQEWASLTFETWDGLLQGSAARRAGFVGLRRNIAARLTVEGAGSGARLNGRQANQLTK